MRVIGGELRGRTLHSPKGWSTRPTLGRVREALFNILALRVVEADVLDLYAGTGALGIEALSRGARSAVLVEADPRAILAIHRNVAELGLKERSQVWSTTAERAMSRLAPMTFHLIFVDPPWPAGVSDDVRHRLPLLLRPEGMLVVQYDAGAEQSEEVWPGLEMHDRRRYGRSGLSFWRPAGGAA
jgi:16S rRNA (guanine(966)-N(2))-methyltransferase RsmD